MNFSSKTLLSILILAYCAWNSRELVTAWRKAPYEHLSVLILLTWCLPLCFMWMFPSSEDPSYNTILLALALTCTLLGGIGSLNTLNYIGLALALASFTSYLNPWTPIWVVGSLSWMPAFSWLGSHTFPGFVFFIRILTAFITAFPLLIIYKRRDQS